MWEGAKEVTGAFEHEGLGVVVHRPCAANEGG
jgi:hypothetical protein